MENGRFGKLQLSGEIIATVEVLDFVGRKIEVSFDRLGELEEVVILDGRVIFVACVNGTKIESRLGRSLRRIVSKSDGRREAD
jgi:hypothetical protein